MDAWKSTTKKAVNSKKLINGKLERLCSWMQGNSGITGLVSPYAVMVLMSVLPNPASAVLCPQTD